MAALKDRYQQQQQHPDLSEEETEARRGGMHLPRGHTAGEWRQDLKPNVSDSRG